MAQLSKKVKTILESDCNHSMEELIAAKKPQDVAVLRSMISDVDSRNAATLSPLHRTKAIYMLGRLKDKEAVKPICDLMPYLDEKGRINAIDALGNIGNNAAMMALVRYEGDPSPQVRKFVVHGLSKVKHPYAKAWLGIKKRFDKEDFVRKTAARYL